MQTKEVHVKQLGVYRNVPQVESFNDLQELFRKPSEYYFRWEDLLQAFNDGLRTFVGCEMRQTLHKRPTK